MKNKQYKRYMVFTWSDYDNVSPFGCFHSDHDDLEEAQAELDWEEVNMTENGCIFDRIEGVILEKFGQGEGQ